MEIPKGTFCQLKSRSSLAIKGIEVKAGTLDASYTGNVGILLYNNSINTYQIQPNERIAQAIFLPVISISKSITIESRDELKIHSVERMDLVQPEK